jgi:large subunit ribosomal protein L29
MATKELSNKSEKELEQEIVSLVREQCVLRMKKIVGQLTKTDTLKKVRRNIARAKTLLSKKKSGAAS